MLDKWVYPVYYIGKPEATPRSPLAVPLPGNSFHYSHFFLDFQMAQIQYAALEQPGRFVKLSARGTKIVEFT
jgi:hypothetical protein